MASFQISQPDRIEIISGTLSHSKSLQSSEKWTRFCEQILNTPYFELSSSTFQFRDDAMFCALQEMLTKWSLQNGTDATAANLIKCLEAIDLFEEADKVRRTFCPADYEHYELMPTYKLKDVTQLLDPETLRKKVFLYVHNNISGLVRRTRLSASMFQYFLENSVFSDDDFQKLKSVEESDDEDEENDQPENCFVFYKMLQKMPQNLNNYIQALKNDKQWRAMWILMALYHSIVAESPSGAPMYHSIRVQSFIGGQICPRLTPTILESATKPFHKVSNQHPSYSSSSVY